MACQYAYYGVPLKRYCEQNNLNYGALYHYLKRHEKEDIIENLIDCYTSAHRSYRFHYINNITLQEYLKYTNIKYSTVINTLSQKRKNPKLPPGAGRFFAFIIETNFFAGILPKLGVRRLSNT